MDSEDNDGGSTSEGEATTEGIKLEIDCRKVKEDGGELSLEKGVVVL